MTDRCPIKGCNLPKYAYRLLGEGFGVEDIAIKAEAQVEDVRRIVAVMRKHGMLEKIYPLKTTHSEVSA